MCFYKLIILTNYSLNLHPGQKHLLLPSPGAFIIDNPAHGTIRHMKVLGEFLRIIACEHLKNLGIAAYFIKGDVELLSSPLEGEAGGDAFS